MMHSDPRSVHQQKATGSTLLWQTARDAGVRTVLDLRTENKLGVEATFIDQALADYPHELPSQVRMRSWTTLVLVAAVAHCASGGHYQSLIRWQK